MPVSFQEEILSYAKQLFGEIKQVANSSIFQISENLFIHLVSLQNTYLTVHPGYYEELSNQYAESEKQLIHLWEDHWQNHRDIIISRLTSFAGITTKIHGRKTKVRRIHQEEFYGFLNYNHLQGAVHSKYKFGLFEKEKLVAVAGFSHPRKITRDGIMSRSSELIRFCNLMNHTVIGGMDKLLKHFITNFEIDDIMSYADRDWSNGKSYERLGFNFIEKTTANIFWVNSKTNIRHFEHVLAREKQLEGEELHLHLKENNYLRIENSGNLKFIKYIAP